MKKKHKKLKKIKKKSTRKIKSNNITSNVTSNMSKITKLVLTESDGSNTESEISSALTKVVATLDSGSEVVLFSETGPVPPVGDVQVVTVRPEGTFVKFVPA